MRFNVTAESQGRLQVARLYQLTEDAGVRDMFSFLLARDTMHQNQWLAAIEELEEGRPRRDAGAFQLPPGAGALRGGLQVHELLGRRGEPRRAAGRAARPRTARGSSSTWPSRRRWAPEVDELDPPGGAAPVLDPKAADAARLLLSEEGHAMRAGTLAPALLTPPTRFSGNTRPSVGRSAAGLPPAVRSPLQVRPNRDVG